MGPIEATAPGEHFSAGNSTLPSRAVAWDAANERMWTACDVRSLLDGLVEKGFVLALDPDSVGRFLRFGGVGCPRTIFQHISWLGPGDTATLSLTNADAPKVVVSTGTAKTKQGEFSPNSPEDLLFQLRTACLHEVGDTSALLALSGGKDSLGLALALQQLELSSLRSVTFATAKNDPDLEIARMVSKRLGFRHSEVIVEGAGMAPDAVQRSAQRWSMPCGDPSVLSYICLLEREGEAGGTLLDGTGNDSSFGLVSKPRDRLKVAASRLPHNVRSLIGRAFGEDSRVSQFTRPPHEALLPGHFLTEREVERLMQTEMPINMMIDSHVDHRDVDGLKAMAIGRFFDPHLASLKARLAADGVGMTAKFPWANENLSNYIRALPLNDRIDRSNKRNKVLLRRLLQDKLDYNAQAFGKMGFKNPAHPFYKCHGKAVLEEVADCRFFVGEQRNAAIEIVGRLIDRLEAQPLRMNALHSMYMFSVWFNHSLYAPRS